MRYTRILLIVMAAALCVAVSGFAHDGPGMKHATLVMGQTIPVGYVDVHNTGKYVVNEVDYGSKLMVSVGSDDPNWAVLNAQAWVSFDPVPVTKKGAPIPGHFNRIVELTDPQPEVLFYYDLEDDFDFRWGEHHPHDLNVAVHADLVQVDPVTGAMILDPDGDPIMEGAWSWVEGATKFALSWGWWYTYTPMHAMRGQFIDSPVKGLYYVTETHSGFTGDPAAGGFYFFPGEPIDFYIGDPAVVEPFYLGSGIAEKKVSLLDLKPSAEVTDPWITGAARTLQTLDSDNHHNGTIHIAPEIANCFAGVAADLGFTADMFESELLVDDLLAQAIAACDQNLPDLDLDLVDVPIAPDEAQGNLEAGLNASGIFRKNVSKTEDWAEDKQKLEVMPVYLPGFRSNGDPSYCDLNVNGIYDEGIDQLGVPYEEWRLGGDPDAAECDPRAFVDPNACTVTLIECRDIAKPILSTYTEVVDIYDDQVTTEFWPGRFSNDVVTAISRDDGTTWKRMNVSRMALESSFDLETGEPFPGTCGSPYLKIDDNYILVVWESKFCDSGNPRYSIDLCDNPETPETETPETGCAIYCRGNPDQGTEVCEPDYPYDDPYFVTDIWGVRGQQQSVNYDEVDDVAELEIGEIPYSCLWAARGVIVTEKELTEGTFNSLNVLDDPYTSNTDCVGIDDPYECCTGAGTGLCDETVTVGMGDIVWFKPERLTSGRRDAYIPMVGSGRGAGFAIVWQEDPEGLRPGKGKGPGEGWSGSGSNHKTDMWYSYIRAEDFARVDTNFLPGGPGGGSDAEPSGDEGYLDKPGLGRPKGLVPFSLPVRISDNDMVNTDTLKVVQSSNCVIPPNGTEQVCFPEVVEGDAGVTSFLPLNEEEIAVQFCDHPDANPDTCCNPDDHENDPNCEDLKGLYGNLKGTKRYAYLAKTVDDVNNSTGLYVPGGDNVPDYQYFVDRGGTLDLCDTSGVNSFVDELPGTSAHERWFTFANASGASKLVCVTSDGRLLDGDVSASRPMLQLQPYTKADGSRSAWVMLAYEETKGMGHSLAAEEHVEEPGDEIVGESDGDTGQLKPIKQDIGKNLLYHSFDIGEPDLVSPGHIVNLPALCGGLYPTWCDDPKTPDIIETNVDNPACTCTAGQPVSMYFDEWLDYGDGTGEWLPDATQFMQYRTEIARRARFIVQGAGKVGASKTVGAIIFKQGQEGQGRPADVFIRRFVDPNIADQDPARPGFQYYANPYAFEKIQCTKYLDESFTLPACPTDGVVGHNCNVWGEAYGDRLCGGIINTPYPRRDQVNLTSHDILYAVDAGPDDDTPDDPTDDRYGTNKVLLWQQNAANLGNESYGFVDSYGMGCDVLGGVVCPAMYSNARSHRGFIRRDALVVAFNFSPNWAAARNGNDRYNFYVRRSFDGGQTWTTTPTTKGGAGVYICPEWRADPTLDDDDGSGHLPPVGIDPECDPCPYVLDGTCTPSPTALLYPAGAFEPARNISEIGNNKESTSDPRIGGLPEVDPVDGRDANQPVVRFEEDYFVDSIFFAAWGTADNEKFTGGGDEGGELAPLDLYYTRTFDWGDTYLKVPWIVGGENSNQAGETVWRYQKLAWGEEEQGECQLKATSDGSKAYGIYIQLFPEEEIPEEEWIRWYPWEVEETHEHDLWFRRLIFWPDDAVTAPPEP